MVLRSTPSTLLFPFLFFIFLARHNSRCSRTDDIPFPSLNFANSGCQVQEMNCEGLIHDMKIIEEGKWHVIKDFFHDYEQKNLVTQDAEFVDQFSSKVLNFLNNSTGSSSPVKSFEAVGQNFSLKFSLSKSKIDHFSLPQGDCKELFKCTCCKGSELCRRLLKNPSLPFWRNGCLVIVFLMKDPRATGNFSLLLHLFACQWNLITVCPVDNTMRNLTCPHCAPDSSSPGTNDDAKAPPSDDKNKRRNRKIAIGVGAGVGGSIITCLLLLIYFRYCKKRSANSPILLSLATSSNAFSSSNAYSSHPSSTSEFGKSTSLLPTHIFSYKELEEATDHFNPSKELGDGGFGTVYHGKLRDGRHVAVKRLYENNYRRVEQFMNEIDILSRLRHPNLVSLYGCTSRHSRELLLVYEYIPNGTIADHLHGNRAKSGSLKWPVRMSIAIETADALAYLHAVDIIHRDVKSNNILLDNNFDVKVADFGLSRLFPMDKTHVSTAPQGTPGYVDPDYHRCYQLNDKSDVYSFGVVLIELISSKPAVDITRHRHDINLANMAINKIQSNALHELVDPTLGYQSDPKVTTMVKLVAELAFRCLQDEKEDRPSMEEVSHALKEMEREDCTVEKVVEVDVPAKDDAVLLKKNLPSSPDSVTAAWVSRATTPNTSG